MKQSILILIVLTLLSCAPKQIEIGMYSNFLKHEMKELEIYIPRESAVNEDISSVKVGWHLEHTLLTINEIYNTMASSNPKDYKKRVNLTRLMMFSGNQIPRGKAKAPQIVMPNNDISVDSILKNYEQAKVVLQKFDDLEDNNYFKHPSAGYLNKADAKRFLKIHTEHHLKIIRDILKHEKNDTIN